MAGHEEPWGVGTERCGHGVPRGMGAERCARGPALQGAARNRSVAVTSRSTVDGSIAE